MNTLNLCTWLLDYIASHPNPSITYQAFDIHLWISSNLSFLSVNKGRSRVGEYYFLGNLLDNSKPLAKQRTFVNALVHIEASILGNIIGAVLEVEIARGYINIRKEVELQIILMEMGYLQQEILLELDNTTSYGILTKQLIPKRSKSINMRLY